MDLDSKIMVDADLIMKHDKMDDSAVNCDPCDIRDRIMCSIVDNM